MKRSLLPVIFLCLSCMVQAKVVLPSFFTDNMVLQQNAVVTFHGKAAAGRTLELTTGWDGQVHETGIAADGTWCLEVRTPAAGGPYTLTFSDGRKLQLKNVMAGEVWFCSGQSNMEMPVAGWGKVMDYEQEIAEADYPYIRLFQVKKNTSVAPLDELEANMGGWRECSPETVPEFSAAAYFYARNLWQELNVPIGVIDCTWGGTPAEAWTSQETLKNVMGFRDEAEKMERLGFDSRKMEETYEHERAEWQKVFYTEDKGRENDVPVWADPSHSEAGWQTMELPGQWEGKGLKGFDGVVWFRRSFDIPEAWEGKPMTLRLGMIDDEDITYLNGTEVAHGSGFATPRIYNVSEDNVKAGRAVLTVRVSDFSGEGGIYGNPEDMYAEVDGQKISLAGEWIYNIGLSLKGFPPAPVHPTQSSSYPSVLFNAMVHPLLSFPVKGVIWYQGEANVGRDEQYARLFPAMIADWRRQWNNPEMPFYFVQLANFMERHEVQPSSEWAYLREAQAQALKMCCTGMAVAIDIGLAEDIHPKNKQEVGRRLALLALDDTYGKPVSSSAPVYDSYSICGNEIEISFNGDGLCASGPDVKGFVIAGPDGIFHSAKAVIKGDKVAVYSPEVEMPQAVRYGWADNPECTLYGMNGLPVAPFRTDGLR